MRCRTQRAYRITPAGPPAETVSKEQLQLRLWAVQPSILLREGHKRVEEEQRNKEAESVYPRT